MVVSNSLIDRLTLPKDYKADLIKNGKIIKSVESLIEGHAALSKPDFVIDKTKSNLLILFATKVKDYHESSIDKKIIRDYIFDDRINSPAQIDAAFDYFQTHKTFQTETFESLCGVGVTVSDEEISKSVQKILAEKKELLLAQKWDVYPSLRLNLMGQLKQSLPWADGKRRTEVFDAAVAALIGPRPANSKPKKVRGEARDAADEIKGVVGLDKYLSGRKLAVLINSEQNNAKHAERTGGVFRARFPPEPNGYLHIGHAKAMNFNFGLAKKKNGICILRFDDTNPLTEETEFIESIKDNVAWLGHAPALTTHSSDYFDALHALALRMIRDGNAYVCHQPRDEIKRLRDHRIRTGEALPSPYRGRSPAENLALFEKMCAGFYRPGEATLRMKGDLGHANPNMWDHVAYRVVDAPHPRTGRRWRVYPSYDFTHCVVDSLEDIDASCCTLEFENRRESYFWLLDVLGLFKPNVWEFSRLNMDYNVMSKRMLTVLVEKRIVAGWDDPRLVTINGLRRRGVPAAAINLFCDKIGVTRSQNSIPPHTLYSCVFEVLDKTVERVMCVTDPLKIVLSNFDENRVDEIKCPKSPHFGGKSDFYTSELRKVIYIERDDFRETDSKKFFGLAPGKTVRLKYAFNIKCENVVKTDSGEIDHLVCTADFNENKELKGVKGLLHWVAETDDPAMTVEIRLFENLFKTKRPGSDGKNWMDDINPESIKTLKTARISKYVLDTVKEWKGEKWDMRLQFERIGFFCLDQSSTGEKIVFNRICPLREAKDKV